MPVQFLVHVYDEPVCTQRPYLYSEVPAGSCVGVQVGTPYTLLLIAENHCSSDGVTMVDIATETFPRRSQVEHRPKHDHSLVGHPSMDTHRRSSRFTDLMFCGCREVSVIWFFLKSLIQICM